MTALTANTPLTIIRGEQSELPMAAVAIYEGAILGDNGAGYARGLVAGDKFRGHSMEYIDNSLGSVGDYNIQRLTGRYRLKVTLTSASILDVGKPLYASDDATYTLEPVGNSRVGQVDRYAAANTIIALFDTNETEPIIVPWNDVVFGAPLAGVGDQDLYDALTTTQHYPLGTERWRGGRKFHYAKVGAAGWVPNMAAKFMGGTAISEVAHAAADVGDVTILIEQSGITANLWKGGFVIMHTAGGTQQNRQIVANSASAVSTNHVTVTLDGPLTTAVTTSTLVEIIASHWSDLQSTSDEYASHAGWPTMPGTVGQYGWVQDGGPCWNTPGGSTTPGDSAQDRMVYYVGDGSVNGGAHLTYQGSGYQPAGFIIEKDSSGVGGPPFVMVNGIIG